MTSFVNLPWYVYATVGMLVVLALAFIAFFLAPAFRVGSQLKRSQRALDEISSGGDLSSAFAGMPRFSHVWTEFRETLHEERATNRGSGIMEVVALRATLPAEVFFTEETLIDTPLRAEFFKHLPGIFTGIGIIGTFTGLLFGLHAFKVSGDATAVRSLEEHCTAFPRRSWSRHSRSCSRW
ncbi:MAG: hypothetical protein U1F14_09275 [Steroidobacteraceae bacterium]